MNTDAIATSAAVETQIDVALAARLAKIASKRADASAPATKSLSRKASGGKRRKNHPAAGSRAAALGLSVAATGALSFAFAFATPQASAIVQSAQVVQPTASTPAPLSSANEQAISAVAATDPVTVNGAVYENRWGPVQVQAEFAPDGTLTDVVVLQSPDADGKSVRINDSAVPVLNSEALSSQSANVDTVSGATYTTNDYRRSLQSAIDEARTAQITQLA